MQMIFTQKEVDTFLDQIFNALHEDQVDVSEMELDHICYRVETPVQYENIKNQLVEKAVLLSEKYINGRPICSFKLEIPIIYNGRKIWVLELPSPKTGSPYKKGFEHVEFVCPNDLETFLKKHEYLDWDMKGFSKKVNRDIRLQYDFGSVKFHENSLEYVIRYLD